jgi:hypothetical protein
MNPFAGRFKPIPKQQHLVVGFCMLRAFPVPVFELLLFPCCHIIRVQTRKPRSSLV